MSESPKGKSLVEEEEGGIERRKEKRKKTWKTSCPDVTFHDRSGHGISFLFCFLLSFLSSFLVRP
jgi:hypothetical protein